MKVLVTGCAGFIGFHLSKNLLDRGISVVGVDSLNDYYDVNLKKDRLKVLEAYQSFKIYKLDIAHKEFSKKISSENFTSVIHLAAQAGVRYSLTNPQAYISSNVEGFVNILELSKKYKIYKLIYASSSSVYGDNKKIPSSEIDKTDSQISLYGATKKSNELMAHAYYKLYGLESVGLRFFSVYGPWGRPDMALFLFTDAIVNDRPINVFNGGKMQRDFTYIDDIVSGIYNSLHLINPLEIYNLGNNKTVELLHLISLIEKNLSKNAEMKMLPMQKGDIQKSFADIDKASKDLNYKPAVSIDQGVKAFIEWYKEYYKVKL